MYRLVNLTCTAFICLAQIIYPQTSSTSTSTQSLEHINGTFTMEFYPQNQNEGSTWITIPNHKVEVWTHLPELVASDISASDGSFNLSFNVAYQLLILQADLKSSHLEVWRDVLNGPDYIYDVGETFYPINGSTVNLTADISRPTNVFVHASKAHDFFENNFGVNFKTYVYISNRTGINAQATDGNTITFGQASGGEWGMSSDVIYHEYTHNVIHSIYGYYPTGTEFGAALLEGIADYFACSINNESVYAESTTSMRELNNNLSWLAGASEWRNGQVIGGACWDLREMIGKVKTDNLVFKALQYSPHPLTETQFITNLKKADQSYYNSIHQNEIIESFEINHEIKIPVPQTPTINISGNWGQSPIISWNSSPSADHYRLKKEYKLIGTTNWCTPYYINSATSPYTDPNIKKEKFGDMDARYSVEAIDEYDFTSGFSDYVYMSGQSLWKNNLDKLEDAIITNYSLNDNYPNPFNPTTTITFQFPESGYATLKIFNSLGQEVAVLLDGFEDSGAYAILFNAKDLPSGMYFATLQMNDFSQTKKMILQK